MPYATVLAFLPDPVMQARVRSAAHAGKAARREHHVVFASGWEEALRIAARSAPDVLIFDPYASGKLDVISCARFASQVPTTALFAYGYFGRNAAQDVLCLARAGVSGVAEKDVDDAPGPFCGLLERLATQAFSSVLATSVAGHTTPEIVALVRHLVEGAHHSITPEAAARFYHRDARTLSQHLKRGGLPPVGKLITWVRLLCAAHLLGDASRSVEGVALRLGFSSDNAFRNQLHRHLGTCPTDLRLRGGLEFALEVFRARCGKRGGACRGGEREIRP